VTFNDNSTAISSCTALTLSSGVAQCTIASLAAGVHSITVSYSGDGTYPPGTSSAVAQTVNAAAAAFQLGSSLNPSIFSQAVILSATLTGSFGTPSGTVTFKDNGIAISSCTAVTLSAGAAQCAVGSFVAGGHVITVTYSGDAAYLPGASANYVQTVGEAVATLDIGSNLNPSIFSQMVTLTVTVTGDVGTPPGGTVTFIDNGTAVLACVAVPLSGGTAQCSTAALLVGGHVITVTYSGDAIYPPATSDNYVQTVGDAAATVDIGLAPNPSSAGQSVTLTATLTGDAGTTPTGIVTFNDNGAAIPDCARLALSGGVAQCATAWPVDGVHVISVTYSGDTIYPPTTSTNYTQLVSG
jgi:hypothetical protein